MNKIIATLGLIVWLMSSCHTEKKEHHEEKLKLQITSPIQIDTNITKDYVCQIHSKRHIELRALERGYLQSVYVDEGQTIKKGQRMFKIMPNVYEAELLKKKAEQEIANIEYENTKMLAEKNVVSATELALAKANLAKATAEVMLSQTHLDFTSVNAPFDGIMDHLHVREGSLLDEGELLTTISDNSNMWVYFNVPEAEYLDFMAKHKDQKKQSVGLEMANGQLFDHIGIIEAIEGEFNNETGNIEFRATFPNPERILRHGETGTIRMTIPVKGAILIPQKATYEILDKKYVYVITADHKLEQRQINVFAELPHLFIVQSGLSPTDKILLEGLNRVHNGEEIEVEMKSAAEVFANLNLYAE